MEKIAFFDSKPYDRAWFDKLNQDFEIQYFESRLCLLYTSPSPRD